MCGKLVSIIDDYMVCASKDRRAAQSGANVCVVCLSHGPSPTSSADMLIYRSVALP